MINRLKPIPLAFWRSASGQEPVREWLKALSAEDKRAIGRDIAPIRLADWPAGLPSSQRWPVGSPFEPAGPA
jgi:hypothetical protein